VFAAVRFTEIFRAADTVVALLILKDVLATRLVAAAVRRALDVVVARISGAPLALSSSVAVITDRTGHTVVTGLVTVVRNVFAVTGLGVTDRVVARPKEVEAGLGSAITDPRLARGVVRAEVPVVTRRPVWSSGLGAHAEQRVTRSHAAGAATHAGRLSASEEPTLIGDGGEITALPDDAQDAVGDDLGLDVARPALRPLADQSAEVTVTVGADGRRGDGIAHTSVHTALGDRGRVLGAVAAVRSEGWARGCDPAGKVADGVGQLVDLLSARLETLGLDGEHPRLQGDRAIVRADHLGRALG
jgi:hypothetical protein